jgi:hypothetical protein
VPNAADAGRRYRKEGLVRTTTSGADHSTSAKCHKRTFSLVALRPRQLAYLYRPARLEVRITGQEGFDLVNARRRNSNISTQMLGDIRRRGAFSHADAAADLAATFEYALPLECLQIRSQALGSSVTASSCMRRM